MSTSLKMDHTQLRIDLLMHELATLRVKLAEVEGERDKSKEEYELVKKKAHQMLNRHMTQLVEARKSGAMNANKDLAACMGALARKKEQRLQDNADLTDQILAAEKEHDQTRAVLAETERNLEFAFNRAMVLANMLDIPVHESPAVTGTILGMVQRKVEELLEAKP